MAVAASAVVGTNRWEWQDLHVNYSDCRSRLCYYSGDKTEAVTFDMMIVLIKVIRWTRVKLKCLLL